ncbi:MAG: caspase family protein, partial [bacterium]
SERIVRFIRKRPVGNIYAVVIGVNKYLNVPSLRYAVGDAKAFADFLTGHLGVPNKNVTMLLDEKVTLRSLRTTLGVTLRKAAGPKDTVIIYYAGHGGTEPDDQDRDGDGLEKYLLPHDADPEALFGTAMSMGGLQSVFRRIRSERLVFIADACYSGAVGGRTILSSRRATVSDQFMNRLSKGKGRIILSAAGANQVAQEDEKLGHGVFTYYLIKALKGAGDRDGDGYVTVDEAYDYVSKAVPKATGQSQTPVRKGTSVGQLYLGRVKAN